MSSAELAASFGEGRVRNRGERREVGARGARELQDAGREELILLYRESARERRVEKLEGAVVQRELALSGIHEEAHRVRLAPDLLVSAGTSSRS